MSSPSPTPAAEPKKGTSYRFTALLVVLLVAAAGGYYLYERSRNTVTPVDEFQPLKPFFTKLGENQKLAAEFADANHDLIADAPTDAAKLLKVDEIGFTVVGTDDEKTLKDNQDEWQGFMLALSAATGKPVKYLPDVPNPDAQMEALKAGRLHVTAFNTGAVPMAVNTAGFVPLFAPADATGNYSYRMEILVKPDSAIQKPEDLKGKTIGFVALSSNSGAKAPMVVLKEKHGLLPGRDYKFKFTASHEASLAELVFGSEYDAVCVASDLKERAIAGGLKAPGQDERKPLRADQVRSILVSDPFPPLCFGVPYSLPPDLRASIEKAFKGYEFPASSAQRTRQGKVRFAAVNYETDWKFVREIDASLARFAEIP